MNVKYKSRKFLMMSVILALSTVVPIAFHFIGVSDTVTIAVLGIYTGSGIAYGIINIKAKESGASSEQNP